MRKNGYFIALLLPAVSCNSTSWNHGLQHRTMENMRPIITALESVQSDCGAYR